MKGGLFRVGLLDGFHKHIKQPLVGDHPRHLLIVVDLGVEFALAILDLLYQETAKALSRADVRAKLETLGFEVVNKPPEESAAIFRAEGDKWTKVIRAAGIKADWPPD
jgi:Tripartite tricarboxylate transporter family receptor